MKHPIQPLHMVDGILRFKENKIVRFLLDNSRYDLNELFIMSSEMSFDKKDWEQFNQLIGYSLGGFGDLDCATNRVKNKAEKKWRKKNETNND